MMITVIFGIIITVLIQFVSEQAVSLFTSDRDVIILGGQYIRGYILDIVFAGIHFCFSGYFCALGRSEFSFIHNTISIIFARIPGAYFTSKLFPHTLFPMGLATTAGSLVSVIICMGVFIYLRRKKAVKAV